MSPAEYEGWKKVIRILDWHVDFSEKEAKNHPGISHFRATHKAWLRAQKSVTNALARMYDIEDADENN